MVATYIKPLTPWRLVSLALITTMLVCFGVGIYLIRIDKATALDYITSIDSLLAIFSVVFFPLINKSINHEIEKKIDEEKSKQIQESGEISKMMFQGFETLLERRLCSIKNEILNYTASSNSQDSLTLSNVENIFGQAMEELRNRNSAIQKARAWIGDKDFLQNLARKSGDYILSKNPSQKFALTSLLSFLNLPSQRQKDVYQVIYDCLLWIRKSFYVGDYTPTEILFRERLKHPELAINALEWIQKEFLNNQLEQNPREELQLYFVELINQARTISNH